MKVELEEIDKVDRCKTLDKEELKVTVNLLMNKTKNEQGNLLGEQGSNNPSIKEDSFEDSVSSYSQSSLS